MISDDHMAGHHEDVLDAPLDPALGNRTHALERNRVPRVAGLERGVGAD